MVLLDFSIFPIGKDESVSKYVARCIDVIDRSGVNYRSHSMGTTLEGEYDEVMAVLRDCYLELAKDCDRIECMVKLDYRRGRTGQLDSKIASVERKLGRNVRK